MDLRTVMLMLAIGSFLFGILLVILKVKNNPQKVRFWIIAKFLQGAGSLLLYFSTNAYDVLTILANSALLLGCAYETWAIWIISGKVVKHRLHLSTSIVIVFMTSMAIFLDVPYRSGVIFLLQSIFYFLPSVLLFYYSDLKSFLRLLLGSCYFITGLVFFISAVICLGFPIFALNLSGNAIFGMIPIVSFGIFLMSGFILLMLAKERSDMQVLEIQKSLEKIEIRFQKIVETAIEGILIFDEHYKITFANQNIASVLGYTIDELVGKQYVSLVSSEHIDEIAQNYLYKNKEDMVYECTLLRKDGQKHWFLVSAKAIFGENDKFEGSFAMLTDINKRKEIELLLELSNRQLAELSNKDGLTGIANRRRFDNTLEHEYLRLKRTNSKLSIILLDVDYFKAYNDLYGHVMGDECLRRIASVLASCVSRSIDLVARYGGEEFACILPDTDIHSALKIAEKIRQEIQELKIIHNGSQISEFITASIGVTTVEYSPEKSLKDIVICADRMLYKAKTNGRNRIEFHENGCV